MAKSRLKDDCKTSATSTRIKNLEATHMVSINMAVINISINNPRAIDVPGESDVLMFKVPGVIASIIAAPARPSQHRDQLVLSLSTRFISDSPVIPPKICEKVNNAALKGVIAPTSNIPRDTAGLKSPPETRKKIQALTAREKPKQRAM